MNDGEIRTLLDARISRARAKELLIALVKVPSPQTERLEGEPLLKAFITSAIEPRLRSMGFVDLRYDAMGNLIAAYGAGTSNKSLMFIGNAMNQPASTMPNPYDGDVVDGAAYGLPGECVMGKGASEQKANLAAMLHAMETVIASKVAIKGKLVFTCCLSGETGKHDAIKSVVEGAGVRADMAVLGGTGLKVTLGNRGRIDVFVTVKGAPCHSSRPWDGVNAVTGATEAIRLLLAKVKVDKSHPQLGRQSLTVNHIRSFPDSTHTVQERCELTLDRRLLPGDDPNEAFVALLIPRCTSGRTSVPRLIRDRGSVALRAIAAQKIAVAVEIHHRAGDFVRAVPRIEIEHLVVLAAAVLAVSPKPKQDIGLLAAQMIFEEFGRASAIEDGAVQEVAAFGFDAVLLRLRDAGEN